MKIFISILLLLVTALYVLPVNEMFKAGNEMGMMDLDGEKEETNKKEKGKELFSFSNAFLILHDGNNFALAHKPFSIAALLHTVETPPPDIA